MSKQHRHALIAISFLAGLQSSNSFSAQSPKEVSRVSFSHSGLTWPLTVDTGRLGCTGSAVWFQTKNGNTYGLNGFAIKGYRDVKEIWSVDEKLEGELRAVGAGDSEDPLRIGIGDMIQEGLKLCR